MRTHGFKHITPTRKVAWEPILAQIGPDWTLVIKKPETRTIRAMEKEGVCVFRDIAGLLFGRLSPAGMALRDAWLSAAAIKAAPKVWRPGTRRPHSGRG